MTDFTLYSDQYYMNIALQLAKQSASKDEIPVGAIIVSQHKIIGKSGNQTQELKDATAHAEMLAITSASHFLGSRYLQKCTLYVTLEPCVMCAGAIFWSQIDKIVFGAKDEKRGYSAYSNKIFPKRVTITGGILEQECQDVLTDFFRKLR